MFTEVAVYIGSITLGVMQKQKSNPKSPVKERELPLFLLLLICVPLVNSYAAILHIRYYANTSQL